MNENLILQWKPLVAIMLSGAYCDQISWVPFKHTTKQKKPHMDIIWLTLSVQCLSQCFPNFLSSRTNLHNLTDRTLGNTAPSDHIEQLPL